MNYAFVKTGSIGRFDAGQILVEGRREPAIRFRTRREKPAVSLPTLEKAIEMGARYIVLESGTMSHALHIDDFDEAMDNKEILDGPHGEFVIVDHSDLGIPAPNPFEPCYLDVGWEPIDVAEVATIAAAARDHDATVATIDLRRQRVRYST
jgi:hypothetical protein